MEVLHGNKLLFHIVRTVYNRPKLSFQMLPKNHLGGSKDHGAEIKHVVPVQNRIMRKKTFPTRNTVFKCSYTKHQDSIL